VDPWFIAYLIPEIVMEKRTHVFNAAFLLMTPAIAVGLSPSLALSQVVVSVRVPESTTQRFVADAACKATVKSFDAKGDTKAVDTLRIRIENDQNKPAAAKSALTVSVRDAIDAKIDSGAASVEFAAKKRDVLPGSALTISRDSIGVCTVVLPAEDQDKADSTRSPYRIGIGGSFDFLSGLSATDLYYDLTIFLPKIWKSRIGIDAGMYSGRTVARRDTIANGQRVFLVPRPARDSVMRITQTRTRITDQTFDKLGLYLAPTYMLTNYLYLGLQAEVVKRNSRAEITLKVESADTVMQRDTLSPNAPIPPSPVPGDSKVTRETTDYVSFYGIAPIVSYRAGGIEFRAKPMIGVSVAESYVGSYAVQFRVTDFDNGFKIGGEVRGPLSAKNPVILVYLAKDFGFKRLANFVVGGDDDK
jgi:hypothetical protein